MLSSVIASHIHLDFGTILTTSWTIFVYQCINADKHRLQFCLFLMAVV